MLKKFVLKMRGEREKERDGTILLTICDNDRCEKMPELCMSIYKQILC